MLYEVITLFQNGDTDLLGHSGINRRLVNHDGSGAKILTDSSAGGNYGRQVRIVVIVNGSGNGDYDELGLAKEGWIGRVSNAGFL